MAGRFGDGFLDYLNSWQGMTDFAVYNHIVDDIEAEERNAWRSWAEDGSSYGVSPESYDSEEEYNDMLQLMKDLHWSNELDASQLSLAYERGIDPTDYDTKEQFFWAMYMNPAWCPYGLKPLSHERAVRYGIHPMNFDSDEAFGAALDQAVIEYRDIYWREELDETQLQMAAQAGVDPYAFASRKPFERAMCINLDWCPYGLKPEFREWAKRYNVQPVDYPDNDSYCAALDEKKRAMRNVYWRDELTAEQLEMAVKAGVDPAAFSDYRSFERVMYVNLDWAPTGLNANYRKWAEQYNIHPTDYVTEMSFRLAVDEARRKDWRSGLEWQEKKFLREMGINIAEYPEDEPLRKLLFSRLHACLVRLREDPALAELLVNKDKYVNPIWCPGGLTPEFRELSDEHHVYPADYPDEKSYRMALKDAIDRTLYGGITEAEWRLRDNKGQSMIRWLRKKYSTDHPTLFPKKEQDYSSEMAFFDLAQRCARRKDTRHLPAEMFLELAERYSPLTGTGIYKLLSYCERLKDLYIRIDEICAVLKTERLNKDDKHEICWLLQYGDSSDSRSLKVLLALLRTMTEKYGKTDMWDVAQELLGRIVKDIANGSAPLPGESTAKRLDRFFKEFEIDQTFQISYKKARKQLKWKLEARPLMEAMGVKYADWQYYESGDDAFKYVFSDHYDQKAMKALERMAPAFKLELSEQQRRWLHMSLRSLSENFWSEPAQRRLWEFMARPLPICEEMRKIRGFQESLE